MIAARAFDLRGLDLIRTACLQQDRFGSLRREFRPLLRARVAIHFNADNPSEMKRPTHAVGSD
jgi:hypothetical protein